MLRAGKIAVTKVTKKDEMASKVTLGCCVTFSMGRDGSAAFPVEFASKNYRCHNIGLSGCFMKRWPIVVLAVMLFFGIGLVAGYHVGVRLLRNKIAHALGPGSSIAELKVNWFSLDLLKVSIESPKGWPAARTLYAERVRIVPSLRSLLTDRIHIASIVFERPYLSVMRTSKKWLMLPGLTETEDTRKNSEAGHSYVPTVTISEVVLQDGVLELFDTTVSRPPLKTRLERLDGVIHDIEVPSLKAQTRFALAASVKGIRRDGRAKVSGWIGPAQRDSSSQITLDGVDLVSLHPYLVRIGEAQVGKGSLDLRLSSEVRANRLDGKGKIIIRDLEFAPARGYLETFMGVPRNALIHFLKNNDNAIDVDFVLTGDTSNPSFSINEAITTRVALGMAAELGVSIRSLAEDFGNLGRRGVEGAAGVAEGVSAVIRGLFGGTNK
jgi:Domain of Unknown Function (DUF748)